MRVATAKFIFEQYVCNNKEKLYFANVAEYNFTMEIFRIAKLIGRCPQSLYGLEDLNGTPIDGQFYQKN